MKTVSIFSIIVLMYIFPAYADVCVPSSNRTLKVVGVASDDTLNARSGFSTNYPVLFELAPNASGIRYLGEKKYKTENCAVLCDQFQNGSSELAPTILRECLKKNRIWYFIQNSDGQYGWVSGKYVEEDEPQLTKVSPARIIPDGKCAIITASFAGEAGALNFLRNQEGNSSPAVLTSKNGNFATVYGIFNLEEGKLRTQQLKTKNMIPTDSYCSQSDRFVDIRFPDPFFANLYYKPSFDCSKAKLPDERAICANSRLAELDQQVASGFRQVQKLKGNDFARNLSRRLLSERKKCGFNFGCIERNQLNAISQYKLYGARLINLDQTDQIVEVNENYSKQDAITYLTILQAYAKLPDNNLDLKFSEKFAAVKPITDGVWNVRLSEAFEALRIHLKGNFAFDKYYENALAKEAARTAAKLEQLSAAIQQEFTALKSWSRNNLLDPRSAEISKLLTAYESADSLNILKLTEILDKAKRLGVSTGTKNDPQASQCSELNLDVCVPDQLCELGTKTVLGQKRWLDNVFYKEAKKLGLSCDVDVPFTQDAAKSYLLQLTDFVSSNGNVFDLSFATEFDKVRAITQGSWSVKLSKDFEQFRLYVEKFPEFQNYIDQKRVLAEAEKKQRVEQLRNAAAQDMTVLKQWAQSNVLDTKAAEIAKLDAKLGEPSLQTIDALEKLVAEVQDLMFSTGVKNAPANAKTQEMVEGLYNPGSIYIFANNSGDAFNLYKAMDGKFTFESGSGTFCASDKLSSLDFYFLREKIFTTFRDLHAVSSNCSIGTDVFLAKGNELTSDRIFDIMAVAGLEKVGEFSRAHRDAAYDQLMYLKKTIKKDVLEGTRMGFGILKSQPNSSKICAIIDENKFGHQEQLEENALLMDAMNLKWNGLEKIVSSSEEAFKFVQRGHCDAIYADALNLGRLYLAGEVASVSFDFIPMWISNNAVEASQKAYDDDMAASAQAKAQAQQSFQDQQILNDQALQSAKELASEQQRALREQHDLRFMVLKDELRRQVFAAVEFGFENPSEQVGYAKKYLSQSFVNPDLRTSPFDEIVRTMQKISSERWEITEQKFDRIDYGSALFKGRSVDAVQVELNISVKNRLIGEFDEYCRRIHAVKDEDFDFWRNISVTDCANEAATSQWRLKNAFQSKWIVEPN